MSALVFIGFAVIWTSLLAGAANLLTRGSVSARFAHAIWKGAAFLSVAPWIMVGLWSLTPQSDTTPVPDVPLLSGAASALSQAPEILGLAQSGASATLDPYIWGLIGLGWLGGIGLALLRQYRLQVIKRNSRPSTVKSATDWQNKLGLGHAPQVRVIGQGTPFLAGIINRAIYLPEAIADEPEADIVIGHECTHLSRGDLISRPFERLVGDLFWFSPFAWAIRRELDYWREAATDAETAEMLGDPVIYARALAKTARLTRPAPTYALPVAAFILPRRTTLKKRLHQLLDQSDSKQRRFLAGSLFTLSLIAAPVGLAQAISQVQPSPFTHSILAGHSDGIAMGFGEQVDPKTGKVHFHNGTDISVANGTIVYAPADGKIITAKYKEGYGNTVDLLLEDGRKIRFSAMVQSFVWAGENVKAGDKIGKVSYPESGADPHLHVEVYDDGKWVDPETVKGLTFCDENAEYKS